MFAVEKQPDRNCSANNEQTKQIIGLTSGEELCSLGGIRTKPGCEERTGIQTRAQYRHLNAHKQKIMCAPSTYSDTTE